MNLYGLAAIGALFAFNLVCFAQTDVLCGQPLDIPLRPSAVLAITSLPAGVEIVGSEHEAIHVSCSADDMDSAKRIRLTFSGSPTHTNLEIRGAHRKHGDLKIRIEVPRRVNLGFRMSAGEVKLDEIMGDKNIKVTAGQITITSAREWDYRVVDASVGIGEVNAPIYGSDKGGFFRTVRREDAKGTYRLHAHVTTGQIDLLSKDR